MHKLHDLAQTLLLNLVGANSKYKTEIELMILSTQFLSSVPLKCRMAHYPKC